MEKISLYENRASGHTRVSNCFIDHFMTEANEAQIKIYLYLLRSVSSGEDISVPSIADRFNYTERDILRSLIYWDKRGLITLDFNEDRSVRGICLNEVKKPVSYEAERMDKLLSSERQPSPVPEPAAPAAEETAIAARPFYSADRIREFKEDQNVSALLFTAERYMKRPLSSSDLNSILYIYDGLHFSASLMEFLIAYCVDSGHRSMRYVETVALDWHAKDITTVEEARFETENNRGEYYDVLKAFGLSGRNPVQSEIEYIRRWKDEYGFSSDLIIEAVNRTMSTISKPSFKYADSILLRWKKKDIHDLSGVKQDDEERKDQKGRPLSRDRGGAPLSTKFQNFSERDYNFSELEKRFARN